MSTFHLPSRMTRLRRSPMIRQLVRETQLCVTQLVAPIFISEKISQKKEIPSMPGQYQLSLNDLDEEIKHIEALGIPAVILFGIPSEKDETGSAASRDNGIIQQAIRRIKSQTSKIMVIADLCFCEYTSHGHCGVLAGEHIDNDKSLDLLTKQALSLAKAGADCLAPSGMLDGMVSALRHGLDSFAFEHLPILSYSVKYCSCFYGPFREAAEGSPGFGDRKSYQMDPANASEALREAALDIDEGADMLMVKPAMNYLDVIFRLKQSFPEIPLCAYQVSGEYSMIKASAKAGLINEQEAMLESLIAIKRAGADFIISYFAKDMALLMAN